jgi:hypothetical protein
VVQDPDRRRNHPPADTQPSHGTHPRQPRDDQTRRPRPSPTGRIRLPIRARARERHPVTRVASSQLRPLRMIESPRQSASAPGAARRLQVHQIQAKIQAKIQAFRRPLLGKTSDGLTHPFPQGVYLRRRQSKSRPRHDQALRANLIGRGPGGHRPYRITAAGREFLYERLTESARVAEVGLRRIAVASS